MYTDLNSVLMSSPMSKNGNDWTGEPPYMPKYGGLRFAGNEASSV